jgi:aspartate-semialdehyde dehydrogenase
MSDVTLAIAGATGVVGKQLLAALERRDYEGEALRLYASAASVGEVVDFADEELEVEACGDDVFRGSDVAILAVPPDIARPLALKAQNAGVWVVDLSGAFRADDAVPLVVPSVNDAVLEGSIRGRVVSLASPPTQGLTAVLEPLRRQFGLLVVDATVLQGAATLGKAGIDRLAQQTAALLNAKEPDVGTFPHRLAFNLVPGGGGFEHGISAVERAMLIETARVWAAAGRPVVGATALFVPTYHGTLISITAQLERRVDADGVRATLRAAPGLKILDDPGQHVYPMPMLVTDDPTVHVGRVRAQDDRVQLVVTLDNAFRIAAMAIDVALRLAERD